MKLALIDVKYTGKISLTSSALKSLKRYKTIALYTTTQFNHALEHILEQLKSNGNVIVSSQPERTNREYQILGCDVYHGNMQLGKTQSKVDAYLYIGDGRFHPNALIFEEEDSGMHKPILTFNPLNNKLVTLSSKDVERVIRREAQNKKAFMIAKKVGVLITTKPGQEHAHYVEKLKKKFPDKYFYAFFCDNIDFGELENFNFIKVWVNTACPRIGKEDILNTEKPLVNVEAVLRD